MTSPDPDAARALERIAWLDSPEGRRVVADLGGYSERDALAAVQRLRAGGLEADLASAAVTQARLRSSALPRLGSMARHLLLTEDGAQQVTRTVVADLHAARFAAAGVRRVADLGCGNGADAMALVRAGVDVLAVDLDPVTAAVAEANLRWTEHAVAEGLGGGDSGGVASSARRAGTARVRVGDATDPALLAQEQVDAIFADPARRSGGRRINDPEKWSPPLSAVLALEGPDRPVGIKVAPGIDHAAVPDHLAAQWVSVDGALVEACLWSPALVPEGPGRWSTVVRTDRRDPARALSVTHLRETSGMPGASDPSAPVRQGEVRPLGRYLYEPDDAVLRAGLVAALAELIPGAGLVSPAIAYLTGDIAPTELDPGARALLTPYRVVEELPGQVKKLRARLRELQVGPLTVKKRGTSTEPEALRKRLGLTGTRAATIVLTPVAGKHSVLLVEPPAAGGDQDLADEAG